MPIVEFFAHVGIISGAIACVGGTLVALVYFFIVRPLKRHREAICSRLKKVEEQGERHGEQLDKVSKHTLENHMELLRHKIFSDSSPLTERVDAGKKYIELGGNGAGAVQHELNVEDLRKLKKGDT